MIGNCGQEPDRLEPLSDLGCARDEWTMLAERGGNLFSTWEWTTSWWRHFGRGRPLLVTAARRADGSLLAILPLYLSATRPLRIARFIGHGLGDQLGPICDPLHRQAAAHALRSVLAKHPRRCDVFIGDGLRGDEGWGPMLGGAVLRRAGSPVLRIDGASWDEFLDARSANFRQQVRSRERRLARAHELRYRLADDPNRLQTDLDSLFTLHEARWGKRRSDSLRGGRAAFHRDFAARALKRGWLRLWFLELDGRAVAAWYGFRFGGAEWYYQMGRDPAWKRESVGFVLLSHSVREAINDGIREYKLLLGDEPYKSRFADEDPGLETVVVPRSVRGRGALAGARVVLRLPQPIRKRLSSLAG